MVFSKVIIWGHKLHSHTHSYIHNSYFNAFKKLGYETFWFDNHDDVKNFSFDNCLFLTEGQVDQKIPLNCTSKYILHHCNINKYKNYNHINLCNYLNDCTLGTSPNYQDSKVEKINYFTYFDSKNKALYQPWGTNLFDYEFDNFVDFNPNINEIFYVGTVWSDNINEMNKLHSACLASNKKLVICNAASDREAQTLVRSSCVAPDVRATHHLNVGYISCRIFKNISYGKIPATNSKYIRDFFGTNLLPYSENLENLVSCNIDFYNSKDVKNLFLFLSNEVKKNHTFETRIKNILNVI